MNNPAKVASVDITAYLLKGRRVIRDDRGDVWIVTPNQLFTKEQRRLNGELGLHKINKWGDKMNHAEEIKEAKQKRK